MFCTEYEPVMPAGKSGTAASDLFCPTRGPCCGFLPTADGPQWPGIQGWLDSCGEVGGRSLCCAAAPTSTATATKQRRRGGSASVQVHSCMKLRTSGS